VSGGCDKLGLGSVDAGPVAWPKAADDVGVAEGRDDASGLALGEATAAAPQAETASAIAGTTSSHLGR